MSICNRSNFLACLDRVPLWSRLEVHAIAKQGLLNALTESGFDDFCGRDYEVMSRLREAIRGRTDDSALWGQAFIDLWFCNNFGGTYWTALLPRDPANAYLTFQAAYWVYISSGANGGRDLAKLLNEHEAWAAVEASVLRSEDDEQRLFWASSVLPFRRRCAVGEAGLSASGGAGEPPRDTHREQPATRLPILLGVLGGMLVWIVLARLESPSFYRLAAWLFDETSPKVLFTIPGYYWIHRTLLLGLCVVGGSIGIAFSGWRWQWATAFLASILLVIAAVVAVFPR